LVDGRRAGVDRQVVRDRPERASNGIGPGAGDAAAADRRAGPPPGWQPFRFPEGGFRAYFPAAPGVVGADNPSKLYVSYGERITCTVRVEARPPNQLALALTELIYQQPHFKKDPDQKPVTLAGRPAVEVESDQIPGARYKRPPPVTVAQYLKAGGAIYVVMIEGRPEVVTDRVRAAFFDSFELTD
jgi:hypothetical protein